MHRIKLLFITMGWIPLILHASLEQEVDAAASSYMTTKGIPGMQIGLWRSGQETFVLEKGLANRDPGNLAPMDRGDYAKIASVTKSFTVMRVLQLVATGQVSLDAPVSSYLGGIPFDMPLKNGDATIRQLAAMRSGIKNYSSTSAFLTDFIANPTAARTDIELVNYANNDPVVPPPPGGAWQYSNTNTLLLGMVVEAVTGHTIRDEILNNLVIPLGLSKTVYPLGNTLTPPSPYVHGYDQITNDPLADDTSSAISPTSLSSAGAIISTLDDIRLWTDALASGSPIPVAQRAMLNAERLAFFDAGDPPDGPFYDSYGLGIGSINGWIGHTGDVPGYQTLALHDPLGDQTLVIMLNRTDGQTHLPTDFFLQISPLLTIPEPSPAWLAAIAILAAIPCSRRRRKS